MKTAFKLLIPTLTFITTLVSSSITAQNCFDMTTLGDFNTIRCIDYNLKNNPDSAKKYHMDEMYGWEGALSSESHPRQHLIATQGADDLCPNLNMLEDGVTPSVLLKMDEYLPNDSAKGAAAAFYYTVDPDYPIIHVNYAAVIEQGHPLANQPGCETYAQPYIRIYLVHDGKFTCVNETYHYNNCKDKEGWTTFTDANSREAIWHDWTTLSIDASQYVGQKVSVVVEAYDCAEEDEKGTTITLCTAHETARFYCNLSCAPAWEMKQTCTPSQTTMTAPKGFEYKWYVSGSPDDVLSTTDTLIVTTPLESTKYTCELISQVGCDPVPHEITVDATRVIGEVKETTICYDDVADFKWDDGTAFDRNVLTHEFDTITADGCDSIAKQRVIIQDTTHIKAVMDTIPESGVFSWRNKNYTEAGTYYDTTHYENTGCAKEIHTLILMAAKIQGELNIAPICADATEASVIFTYEESEPKQFKLMFSNEAKEAGFKDTTLKATSAGTGIAQFNFPIPQFTEKVNAASDKVQYVMPGTYDVTIRVIDLNNVGKDFATTFSIMYPAWLIGQRWNDMLLILNNKWNGHHNFTNVRWFMGNDSTEIKGRGEHHSYVYSQDYGSASLDVNSDYWAELELENGKIICTCKMKPTTINLTDEPAFGEDSNAVNSESTEQRVQIAPAVIDGNERIMKIRTDIDGTYTLFTLNGIAIQHGQFSTNTDIHIIDVPAGAYIVTFKGNEGTTETKKIIITL